MRRITKAALGGLAGGGLVLAGTMAAGASTSYRYVDKLEDFSATEGPFDSTTGKVTIVENVENDKVSTTFSIKITGIDTSAAEEEFGAHLHTGRCVDGDFEDTSIKKMAGSLAGPHYNTNLDPADPDLVASYAAIPKESRTAATEVWFNLVPSEEDGAARFQATVPFVPVDLDGTMSIVIHVTKNDQYGGAGVRQACFPLSVPQWIPEPPE